MARHTGSQTGLVFLSVPDARNSYLLAILLFWFFDGKHARGKNDRNYSSLLHIAPLRSMITADVFQPPRSLALCSTKFKLSGPYDESPVACRDIDPRAGEIARQVAGLISGYWPAVRAEHVGSTAVPGCGGRGIVDLLIACPEKDIEQVSLLLERLGFRQGNEALFPPHPPAYRGAWARDGDVFLLHVHVLPAGAAEVDSMRFLRACLRADAELARAYTQHKQAIISGGVVDAADYCRQKAAFLKLVLG